LASDVVAVRAVAGQLSGIDGNGSALAVLVEGKNRGCAVADTSADLCCWIYNLCAATIIYVIEEEATSCN
jgi:hypothetical protein